jgi:uncharacterized repeat protein (TIGR03803 family)
MLLASGPHEVGAQLTYDVLKSFGTPELSGTGPYAGLIRASDGALYGTTSGGNLAGGTVFRMTQQGTGYSVLWNFNNVGGDGQWPLGGVTEGSDGVLYGTTQSGGTSNLGTVFKLNRDGSGYGILRSLGTSTNDGSVPWGRLVEGSDGALYGTTAGGGGATALGTVFKLKKDGTGYTVLHSFSTSHDGYYPRTGLLEGSDGALYGTTEYGGSDDDGIVFKLSKNGSGYEVLHNFGSIPNDGEYPYASLIEGGDGLLYGATSRGSTNNAGVVFKLKKDGSGYTVLHRFSPTGSDARQPYAALLEGSDSAVYGTTLGGGSSNRGAIFMLNKDGGNYAVLHSFGTVTGDGRGPLSSLVQGSDGALFGVTSGGGARGQGIVFRLRVFVQATLTLTMDGPRLEFVGAPGRSYEVRRAVAISGPWDAIATRVAGSDGRIEYTDPAPPQPMAFYRVRSLP